MSREVDGHHRAPSPATSLRSTKQHRVLSLVVICVLHFPLPSYAQPPQETTQPASSSPCTAKFEVTDSEEWIRTILNSLIAIAVGFGAAVVGALATRKAAERQSRSAFEAQRVAHQEALQHEVRLAHNALKREIEINNSIMNAKTKLFRRIPLQKAALDRIMRIAAELPCPVVEPLQNMYFFIEKYNSLVSLLSSSDASVSPEIIAEIERMTAAGITIIHQSSNALNSTR